MKIKIDFFCNFCIFGDYSATLFPIFFLQSPIYYKYVNSIHELCNIFRIYVTLSELCVIIANYLIIQKSKIFIKNPILYMGCTKQSFGLSTSISHTCVDNVDISVYKSIFQCFRLRSVDKVIPLSTRTRFRGIVSVEIVQDIQKQVSVSKYS